MYVSTSICQSVCEYVSMYVWICQYAHVSEHVQVYQYVHVSEHGEYVSMSICQSMCEHVRRSVYANMSMSICQHVWVCQYVHLSECDLSPMRGHWPWGAVCTSTALPSTSLMEKLRHLAEAALRLSCPSLAPTGHFLCGYNSVYKRQSKRQFSPQKEPCSLLTGAWTRLLLTLRALVATVQLDRLGPNEVKRQFPALDANAAVTGCWWQALRRTIVID